MVASTYILLVHSTLLMVPDSVRRCLRSFCSFFFVSSCFSARPSSTFPAASWSRKIESADIAGAQRQPCL